MNTPVSIKKGFTREKVKSLVVGLLIALAGAAVTWLQSVISKTDFGQYAVLVGAINSFLVNAVRKYLQEEEVKLEK